MAATTAGRPTVLLVTEPHMRSFTVVDGTALADGPRVLRLDKAAGGDDPDVVARFDDLLPEVDALLVSPWSWSVPPFDADRWARARRLKVVAGTFSHRFAGWLDVSEASRRGVTLVDTSRTMSPSVAEFGLAMMLACLRDIPAAVQLVRAGSWRSEAPWDQPGFVHGDLSGRAVGLAGFGGVNRRLAELLRPFSCDVQAFDPYVTSDVLAAGAARRADTLVELAAHSEVFVVGLPPTPATKGLVSAEVIDALPRGTIVVVLSRMMVVDQAAVWRRAQAGEIRVAVDVFDPEPPPADATFRVNPWVIPTPHIAGATTQCHRRCFTAACADVAAVLAGRPPTHAVSIHDDRLSRGTKVDAQSS